MTVAEGSSILEGVVSIARRLPVAFLALALAVGQTGLCAGWMPTPEARMACCSGGGLCPMHGPESNDNTPTRTVTQADADRCCAASEGDDSAPSPSSFVFAAALAIVLSPVPTAPEPDRHASLPRPSAPLPASHVPRHVLHSVFLV